MTKRTVWKVAIVLLIVFALAGFGVMMAGCSALLGDQDPEIQARLTALELRAAQARAQAQDALAKVKANGFDSESLQLIIESMASVNQITQEINAIRNQPGGGGSWLPIILSIISGLAGYPIMRTARLKYSNSSVSPP